MAQPKVSIIVPVYNVEKYLERCLDSLRNQSLKEIEIILVDDSSPDACPALCDEAAEKDSRIKVIHKANAGAGMARNSALEIATGEYIGFVDSDDFVDKDMYRVLYEKAKESESDLVLSGVLFVDGNMFQKEGEVLCKTYFEKDTLFETQEELNLLRMGIVGAMPDAESDSEYGMSIWKNLFRTAIIKENHLSFRSEREIFSEDGMFMVDFVSHIKKALGIPEAFYNYCRNGDSLSKSYKKDRLEKGLAFVFAAEENFKRDLSPVKYQCYIDRFWQAFCRVLCSQEIMNAKEKGIKWSALRKNLKSICENSRTKSVLSRYPIQKLPVKQRIFAYGMKYRLYFLLKLFVGLRNR